jgi:hypothetical protein
MANLFLILIKKVMRKIINILIIWYKRSKRLFNIFVYLVINYGLFVISCNSEPKVKTSIKLNLSCETCYDSIIKKNIYCKADTAPKLPGNLEILKYFKDNFVYPQMENPQLSVFFEIIVDSNGSMLDVRIRNKKASKYTILEKEIVKVFSNIKQWKPAICEGKRVPFKIELAIKF